MKKVKRWLAAGLAIVMCLGLSACGKDFDAAGYTKAALDANYHGEYKEYAKFRQISEDEAKAEVSDAMAKQINSAFIGMSVEEAKIAEYTDMANKVYALAKYEVKEAKKQDDDSFIVTLSIYPADAFKKSAEYAETVAMEYVDAGKNVMDDNVLVDILMESMTRGIADNAYGEETTFEVHVTPNGDKAYGIEDAEMEALEAAMFPQA